jgi:hypothetical protein
VIEGALIALAGVLIGRFLPGRRRHPKPPKPAPPPKPVCGCTHHFAMHDPQSKACHGTVKTPEFNRAGGHVGYTYPACACRQYVGPVPMPEFFASEIGGVS